MDTHFYQPTNDTTGLTLTACGLNTGLVSTKPASVNCEDCKKIMKGKS